MAFTAIPGYRPACHLGLKGIYTRLGCQELRSELNTVTSRLFVLARHATSLGFLFAPQMFSGCPSCVVSRSWVCLPSKAIKDSESLRSRTSRTTWNAYVATGGTSLPRVSHVQWGTLLQRLCKSSGRTISWRLVSGLERHEAKNWWCRSILFFSFVDDTIVLSFWARRA